MRKWMGLLLLVGLAWLNTGLALESGTSNYFPGDYDDFMMAYVTSSGAFLRNDLLYYQGKMDIAAIGGKVRDNYDLSMWLNTLKGAYFFDGKFLGGLYGVGASLPYTAVSVDGFTHTFGQVGHDQASTANLSDVYLMPLMLAWNYHRQWFFMFYQGIYLPTGFYRSQSLATTGMNTWSFDPSVAFTWLSQDMAHEVDITVGYLMSTKNTATDYQSGNLLHIDWLLAKRFNRHWALGLTGFYMQQFSDDGGSGALLGANKAFAWGVGPALQYELAVGKDKELMFLLKYMREVDAQHVFKGDIYDLAFSLSF